MTDRELVNEVLHEHRTQAFAQIVSRYSGMVFSKALGMVKREELAKEVAQQTFVKAYERLAYWRSDKLGPWLVTIAMHTALNELERERRSRRVVVLENEYDERREELLQLMEQAIGELGEPDCGIVRMYYYEQRKTDEIARQTGLSQSNVLVRLHRIRERLRKRLENNE